MPAAPKPSPATRRAIRAARTRVDPARALHSYDGLTAVNLGQELLPERRVGEGAAPERRHRRRVLFDAAHSRAQVRGLEVDGDTRWRDKRDQGVRDLLAEPFLNREALAE